MPSNEPLCNRCGGITKYGGSISLPPHDIYSCESCGNNMLIAGAPGQTGQPQTQQQPQPQKEPEE
jgi:hypothetical protein